MTLELILPSHVSFVAVVRVRQSAVLKIPLPGVFPYVTGNLRFDEHKALRVWDGDGAVRLLAHDDASDAVLLERCVPGGHLSDIASLDEADVVVADLLARHGHDQERICSVLSSRGIG